MIFVYVFGVAAVFMVLAIDDPPAPQQLEPRWLELIALAVLSLFWPVIVLYWIFSALRKATA